MKIKVFYFDGCPHYEPTLTLVREAVRATGVDARIESVHVLGPEDAEDFRFFGSPTVHVNDHDIDPSVRGRVDYSYGCRLYRESGTPPLEMIEAALLRARGER